MIKNAFQNSKGALFAGLLLIVIATSGWQAPGEEGSAAVERNRTFVADTTHPGTVAPDKINLGIKTDSLLMAAQTALSAIDFSKMQQEISASLASINFDEIGKDIESAFKNIEWEKIQGETKKALEEAKAELAKINRDEMKAEMEKAKAEVKKVQENHKGDFAAAKKEAQEGLARAKKELETARAELSTYRTFITTLEKDGLLKAGAPYEVSLKNNILHINGVQQDEKTTEKYRKFYQGKTNFTLYDNKTGTNTSKTEVSL